MFISAGKFLEIYDWELAIVNLFFGDIKIIGFRNVFFLFFLY